jgi:hypothetical protein
MKPKKKKNPKINTKKISRFRRLREKYTKRKQKSMPKP